MIRLLDALALAQTKLRTRKIRTTITIIVSGLLFSLAATVAIVTDGIFNSYENMSSKSLTSRYIIGGVQAYQDSSALYSNPEIIAKAEEKHKTLVAEKKAEAKRLGIEYDPSSDPAPTETVNGRKQIAYNSPVAQSVLNEAAMEKFPMRTLDDFKTFAKKYNPTQIYSVESISAGDGTYAEMLNGQEKFTTDDNVNLMSQPPDDIHEPVLAPSGLLTNFMLANHQWEANSGRIPVVVTQKRAATLTGYKAPSADASTSEKLNYVNELRKKVSGVTFEVCYRNSASTELIAQATTVAKEIEERKNDRTYTKPNLIYDTPDPASCGEATIKSDTRSAGEKLTANKYAEFARKFNPNYDPVQQKLTYEVVGVTPNGWSDTDVSFSMGAKDLITGLLMTQTFRFAIPAEMYDQITDKSAIQKALTISKVGENNNFALMSSGQYFAEFSSSTAARDFAKNESCQYTMSGCEPVDKYFMLMPFGSNSIAIDEAKANTATALLWITGIVSALAAIIASLTIGRTIADGRRETSVFRAIGFKRLDIAQIYSTYTLLLALLTIIFTLIASTVVAVLINNALWLETTLQAQLALGTTDTTQHFSYIGFTPKVLIVLAMIVISGLLGMILPLIRNIRRNPIKDMRDE